MRCRTPIILACAIALGARLLPPVAASQSGKPPRGARVAVVAFHDSRLLTLCPVFGKHAVVSDIWTPKMAAKVTVFYPPTGQQSIGLHFEPANSRRLMLPMPAGQSPGGSSSRPAPAFVALDRLARDIGVERRLAAQFRARQAYTVVDSPAEADFVLVAESTYIAMTAGTADPPPPRQRPADEGGRNSAARIFHDTEAEWNRRTEWRESLLGAPAPPPPAPPPSLPPFMGGIGGDRHTNWRQSIIAVAVPAEAYRQYAGDGAALSASSVWSGVAAAGWGPRTGDARTMSAASPEELVDGFHTKGSGLPDYLPVCAATAGTIRDPHEDGEAAAAPLAQPAEAPGPPRPAVERGPGRPRFTSGITLVTVPITVTGPDGQPVRDLPLSAFRVFENDVEQQAARLEQGTVPTDVVLLVDTSGSMRAVRERIGATAAAVAGALRTASRALIVTFDSRIRVTAEFTSDPSALQRALAQAAPGGGTRLYDALALVAVERLGLARERNAIVLLSDGRDTQSQLTDDAGALAAIETSNTPVFVIRYETAEAGVYVPSGAFGIRHWIIPPDGPEQQEAARADADRFLARLSADTGGRLIAARPDADVADMLAHIANELSNQVVLGYYPSNGVLDGSYRRIRVEADCEGCSVRARRGYRAGAVR